MKDKVNFWQSFYDIFPREAGIPSRLPDLVKSAKDILLLEKKCILKRQPLYLSIYSLERRKDGRVIVNVDLLFFDFDYPDTSPSEPDYRQKIEKVWRVVRNFVKVLSEKYNAHPVIFFSGKKGFHVYVFLSPEPLRIIVDSENASVFKEAVRRFVEEIAGQMPEECIEKTKEGLWIKYLDKRVIGDLRRIARVPYTKHHQTSMYVVKVEPTDTIEEVFRKALNPRVPSYFTRVYSENIMSRLTQLMIQVKREIKEAKFQPSEEAWEYDPRFREIASEIMGTRAIFLNTPCMKIILNEPHMKGARRMVASKLIAIAYYLDYGTTEGLADVLRAFAEKQRIVEPLKPSEAVGWVRGIQKWIKAGNIPRWNCAEVRQYIKDYIPTATPPCNNCPLMKALKRYRVEVLISRKKEELLNDFNFIRLVKKTLDYMVFGENTNKILAFLTILNKGDLFVLGETSSGKTVIVDSVLKLFPEDMVMDISAMSKKAIIYYVPNGETIPIVYLREITDDIIRSNSGDEAILIKFLMSDKMIKNYTTMRNGDMFQTQVITIYVDSFVTTSPKFSADIPEDFLNRAVVITPDNSEKQTKIIIERIYDLARIPEKIEPSRDDIDVIRRMVRFLWEQEYEMVVPYSHTFSMLLIPKFTRARRDAKKFLKILESIVKVNLYGRLKSIDEKTVLLAHPFDAIFMFILVRNSVALMIYNLDNRSVRVYEALIKKFLEKNYSIDEELMRRKSPIEVFLEMNIDISSIESDSMFVFIMDIMKEVPEFTENTIRGALKSLVQNGLAIEEKLGIKNGYVPLKPELWRISPEEFIAKLIREWVDWIEKFGDRIDDNEIREIYRRIKEGKKEEVLKEWYEKGKKFYQEMLKFINKDFLLEEIRKYLKGNGKLPKEIEERIEVVSVKEKEETEVESSEEKGEEIEEVDIEGEKKKLKQILNKMIRRGEEDA